MWLIFVLVFLAGVVVGSAGLVGGVAYSLGLLTKKSEKKALAMASEAASKTLVIQEPKKDSRSLDSSLKSNSSSDKTQATDSESLEDSTGSRRSISRQSSTNSSSSPTSNSTDDSVSGKAMDPNRKSSNFSGRTKMLHKSPTENSATSLFPPSGSTDDLALTQRHSMDATDRKTGRLKREESINLAGSSVEDEDAPELHDAGPGGVKFASALHGSKKTSHNHKSASDFSSLAKIDEQSTRNRSSSITSSAKTDTAVSDKFNRASGIIPTLPPMLSGDSFNKQASKVSRMLGLDVPLTARSISTQSSSSMGVATSAAFSLDRSDSTSSLAAGDLMISSRTSLSSSQLIREQMQQLVHEGRISVPGSAKSSSSDSTRNIHIKHLQHKLITSSAPSTGSGASTPVYNGTPPTSRRASTALSSATGSGSSSKLVTHSAPPTAASTFSSSSSNLPTLASVASGDSSSQLLGPNNAGRDSPQESATERFKLPEKDTISSRRNLTVQTAVPMRLVKRETFIKSARETANVDAQRRKVVIEVRETFGVLDAFSASESHSLFCRVAVCKQRYKTGFATRERGGRAKWGSEMIVSRVDAVHTDRIHFELMTRDRLYLGHAVTRLSDLLKDAQKDVWLPLRGVADHGKTKIPSTGELRVSLTLLAYEDPIPLTKPRSSTHTHDHSHDFKTSNSLADSLKSKMSKKHKNEGYDSSSSSSSDSDSENISATEDSSEFTTNFGRSRASSEAISGDWWDPASSKRVSVPISEKMTPLPATGSYQTSPYSIDAPPGSTTATLLSGGGWTGLGNLRGTNMPVASQSAPITRDPPAPLLASDSAGALGGSLRTTVKRAETISTSTAPASVPSLSLANAQGIAAPVPLVSATPSARVNSPLEPALATAQSPSGVPANAIPVVHAFTNPAVHDSQVRSEYVDPSVAVNTSPQNPRNTEPVIREIGRDTFLNHDGTPVASPEITRSNEDKSLMTSRRASIAAPGSGSSSNITHSSPAYTTIVSSGGSSAGESDRNRVSFSPDAVRAGITGCSVPGTTAPSVALSGMQYTPVAIYNQVFDPPRNDAQPPSSTPYFIVGKQGWLNVKLNFKQSKWESRWCVLDGNAFRIYEDKYSQAALANLPLFTAKVSKMATKRHHIKLSLPKDAPFESAQLKPLPIPNDPSSTHISPWFHQINNARKISRQYLERAPPLPDEFIDSLSLPQMPSTTPSSSAPSSIVTSSAHTSGSYPASINSSRDSKGGGGDVPTPTTSRLSVPIDVSSITHSTSTEVSPRPKTSNKKSAAKEDSGSESDLDETEDMETTDEDEFFSDYEGSSATESSAMSPRPPECEGMTSAELRAWKKKRAKEARVEKKRLKKLRKQEKKAESASAANSDKESKENSVISPRPSGEKAEKGEKGEKNEDPLSSSSAASTPRSSNPTSPRSASVPLSRPTVEKKDGSATPDVRGSSESPIPVIPTITTDAAIVSSKESKESRKRLSRATSLKEDKTSPASNDAPLKSPRATDNIVEAAIAGGIGDALKGTSKKDIGGDLTARDPHAPAERYQMDMRLTTTDYDGSKEETEAKVARGQTGPSLSKKEDAILGVESALISAGVMKEDEMTEYIRKEEEEERRSYVLANVTPLKRIPDHVEAHDAGFLNLVLWRMFRDMQTSELFANDVAEKIRAKIETVKLPPFLGNLRVLEMDYGKDFIKVDSIKVVATEVTDEVIIEADVRYEGGLAVTLGIEFYLNWPRPKAATIPVTAIIKLKTLRGKLHILLPSTLNTKNSMCFVAPPAVEFDVSIDIGKGEGRYAPNFDFLPTPLHDPFSQQVIGITCSNT